MAMIKTNRDARRQQQQQQQQRQQPYTPPSLLFKLNGISSKHGKRWVYTILILAMLQILVGAQDTPTPTTTPAPTEAPTIGATSGTSPEPTVLPSSLTTDDPTPTASPTTTDTQLTDMPSGGGDTSVPTALDTPTSDTTSPAPTPSPTLATTTTDPTTEIPTITPTLESTTPLPTESPAPTESPTNDPATDSPTPFPTPFPSIATNNTNSTSEPSEIPSSTPSMLPSLYPSLVPSAVPSLPSALPTLTGQPTVKSTTAIAVQDDVSILLSSVTSRMSGQTPLTLQTEIESFLSQLLGELEQPIFNVDVNITGQSLKTSARRRAQQTRVPLQVDMHVSGDFEPKKGLAETAQDVNLGLLCRQLFNVQSEMLIDGLRVLERVEDIIYFQDVTSVTSVPVNGDSTTPAAAPANDGQDDDSGGLSLWAIIGIAVGGGVALLALVALFVRSKRDPGAGNDASSWGSGPTTASAAERKKRFFAAGSTPSTRNSTQTTSITRAPTTTSTKTTGGGGVSAVPVSPPIRRVDSDVNSDMQSLFATDTMGGNETMSYTYSLDHGIDQQSTTSMNTPNDYSSFARAPVPTEIPHLMTNPSLDDDDNNELDFDPGYLPQVGNKITRECFAPPGKLGIVIDTTVDGPVVHTVHPGSPLEGILWSGDIIIAIDDVDTRAMSADAITALMAKNIGQRRKLTIVSDTNA